MAYVEIYAFKVSTNKKILKLAREGNSYYSKKGLRKEPLSGAEAFDRYIKHTLPSLRESGGEVMFLGNGGEFLIGPEEERWDIVMIIRQSTAQSFLAFSSNEAYLIGIGHRTAAIEDSRLLPMSELPTSR